MNNHAYKDKPNKRPLIRIYSEKNFTKFKDCLENTDWGTIIGNDDTETSYCNFYTHLYQEYNLCFPLVRLSKKRAKDKKWLTSELKSRIKTKQKLFKKSKSHPTTFNISEYNNYRNSLTSCLRQAEMLYYEQKFADRRNGISHFWKTFGQTLNSKNKKTKIFYSKTYH